MRFNRHPLAIVVLVTVLVAWAGAARAHVAPSPDANNRYGKITLLGGSVRIAYTVFFGDHPGLAERRRMDKNGDGAIDPSEAAAFGADLLAGVTPALHVTIDGAPPSAAWVLADVGLGTPTVTAGAFSVDLVLTAPLPRAADPEHSVRFDDTWQVPAAGEAQTRIEESPGVHVLTSGLAPEAAKVHGLEMLFTWTGNPRNDRGLTVTFTADPEERIQVAPVAPPVRGQVPSWLVILLVAFGGVLVVTLAKTWTGASPR